MSLIYSALSSGVGKCNVLNAGTLSQPLLDYFKQFNCDVWVLDIYDDLVCYEAAAGDSGDSDEAPEFPPLLEKLGEHRPACDLVLMWDYFNYLSYKTISLMMEQLSRVCREGALLYFFTTLRGDMPSSPGEFRFLENERLEYIPSLAGVARSPEYGTNQLSEWMPSFSVLKLSRLGNGLLQENLFRFNEYKPPRSFEHRVDLPG